MLCRNLVFTYLEPALQCEVLLRLGESLRPGGALVIGAHERLAEDAAGFQAWIAARGIHRRQG
jgi:chemotaxis protein methyltransferase CheR